MLLNLVKLYAACIEIITIFQNITSYTPNSYRDRELGIQTARPKHPSLVLEATRLASFDRWPQDNPVSPDRLARAGFYYTGNEDTTVGTVAVFFFNSSPCF